MKDPTDVAEVKPLLIVMSARPKEFALGVVKVRLVSETMFGKVILFPIITVVSPVNPVPVRVTKVPPVALPVLGETEVMVGAGGAV